MNNFVKSALFLMLVSGIIFVACSKEDVNSEATKKELSAKLIGELHNKGVEYIYNLAKKKKVEVTPDLYYKGMTEFLINIENFPSYEVLKAIDESKVITDRLFAINKKTDYSIQLINQLKENEIISDEFKADVVHLLDIESYNNNTEYMMHYINVNMENKKWSDNDLLYFNNLKEVANASYKYWATSTNYKNDKKIKDSSWVIINDTIGGVLGLPFGGFGSLILGGFLSLGTNEGW